MIRADASLVITAAILLGACTGDERHLPEAVGGQGEVLVVMPKGNWESEPGAVVRSILEQPVEGLPQREARFSVAQVAPDHFGSMLATHHSVLMASIDGNDSSAVSMVRDRNARGQLIIQISAPDPVAWSRAMQQHAGDIVESYEEHQRSRVAHRLAKEKDASLSSSIRSAFGVSIDIPGGYHVMEQVDGFAWLQRDRMMSGGGLEHNVIEGVLVHTMPYTDPETFTVPYLVDRRDSVTRERVEGPVPGSYMIVQRGFEDMDLMPNGRAVQLDGRFAYVMHGLYGMQGAKMGGPFVSLSTVDEIDRRVITVEGFVYAPQFDKREYMRELEALLYSLRIDPPASP